MKKQQESKIKEYELNLPHTKVIAVILAIQLLNLLPLRGRRAGLRWNANLHLKKLLRELRRDVIDADLTKNKRYCWSFYGDFILPDWLRKAWMNTLQPTTGNNATGGVDERL